MKKQRLEQSIIARLPKDPLKGFWRWKNLMLELQWIYDSYILHKSKYGKKENKSKRRYNISILGLFLCYAPNT